MKESELGEIRGIGHSTAEKLTNAGYDTIEKVAGSKIREIQRASERPVKNAKEIIADAKKIMKKREEARMQKLSEQIKSSKADTDLLAGAIAKKIEDSPELRRKVVYQAMKDKEFMRRVAGEIMNKLS